MSVCDDRLFTPLPPDSVDSGSACLPTASSEYSVPEGYLILSFDKAKRAKLKTAMFADVSDARFADALDEDGDEEATSQSEWSNNESPQVLSDSSGPLSSSTTASNPALRNDDSLELEEANSKHFACYGEAVWVGEDTVHDSVRKPTHPVESIQPHSLIRTSPITKPYTNTVPCNSTNVPKSTTVGHQIHVKSNTIRMPLGINVHSQPTSTNPVVSYSGHLSLPMRLANKRTSEFLIPRLTSLPYIRTTPYQRNLFNRLSSDEDGKHSKKMLRCDGCGKYYRNEYSLNHHICLKRKDVWKKGDVPSEMIDGQMVYFCPTCHKPFKWLGNLTRHFYVHTGQRFFKCDVCAKEFFSAYQVKRHMNSHTGVRHKCEVCEKPFTCMYACAWHTRQHYNYVE